MNDFSHCIYEFDGFLFDADRLALYYGGELLKGIEKKSLEVLAVILQNPNQLVSHDEIIDGVWGDNLHGATQARVNQHVSKLKKIFVTYDAGPSHIENSKGIGYIFTGNVVPAGDYRQVSGNGGKNLMRRGVYKVGNHDPAMPVRVNRTKIISATVVGLILLTLGGLWFWYPRNADNEIRRVVKDSQIYESLVLYKNPRSFNEPNLDKYWTPELEINANYDRQRIRDSVSKLVGEGRHYGDETKCEQFEFQSVEINADRTMAVVKTLEKWFIAVYFIDGTLQKNRTVGPYFVSYILKKIDGHWLIEKSSTARVNRPTPRLADIETETEPRTGQGFYVKITGQDLEPETIYLEVTGSGCPEIKPCKIPHSALLEKSKMTGTVLENVPLTLASGVFAIAARNGDSPASNPVYITVP